MHTPRFSLAFSQLATNYTTLNIHTRSMRAGGSWEIYITIPAPADWRERERNVTDNTLKVLSWNKIKKNFFRHPRSTWKINSASHVCHHNDPRLYLQFTRRRKLWRNIFFSSLRKRALQSEATSTTTHHYDVWAENEKSCAGFDCELRKKKKNNKKLHSTRLYSVLGALKWKPFLGGEISVPGAR